MHVYALVYSVGCSTGYSELVGLYSTLEKAEKAKKIDMLLPNHILRFDSEYSITAIELDKEINNIFVDW